MKRTLLAEKCGKPSVRSIVRLRLTTTGSEDYRTQNENRGSTIENTVPDRARTYLLDIGGSNSVQVFPEIALAHRLRQDCHKHFHVCGQPVLVLGPQIGTLGHLALINVHLIIGDICVRQATTMKTALNFRIKPPPASVA